MSFRINQKSGKTLLIGSFIKRKISQVVQGATRVAPIAMTRLVPKEVLLEFEKATSVAEAAIILHAMSDWDNFKVPTHCIMAWHESLIYMFHEQEMSEREKQLLHEEKVHYQSHLGQVVEKIGSQIEQLDRKIESESPVIP